MDEKSVLYGDELSIQCETMITALSNENNKLQEKIKSICVFIESDTKSSSVDVLKGQYQVLSDVLFMMIEANEKDILDLKTLYYHTQGITIIGKEVLENEKEAKWQAQRNNEIADHYYSIASTSVSSVVAAVYYELSQIQRDISQRWENLYQYWRQWEDRFDCISNETTNLFEDGRLYRDDINQILDKMLQCRSNTIGLTSPKPYMLNHSVRVMPEIVPNQDELQELADRHGYSENELEYLCMYYPGLINTVYAMDNHHRSGSEIPLQLIRYYLTRFHENSLVVGDYEFPDEMLQLLRDLEQGHWGLVVMGYGEYDAFGELIGIWPHYVNGESDYGITFGYGHYIDEEDYEYDELERAIIDEYIVGTPIFEHGESDIVPNGRMMPIEVVNELFESDIRSNLDIIIPWLNENEIDLSTSQVFALVIHRFLNGELGEHMCELLCDYRDCTLSPDIINQAWADNTDDESRRQTCQLLFWGDEALS